MRRSSRKRISWARTFGALLNAQIMKGLFETKARKYDSCLERSLDRDNIPVQVFRSLVANVNGNLGTLHRYLKLRQRILGVDELHYFYAYPYATAFTASAALSELVLNGDKAATRKYLDFLSAGGSNYAMALLKKSGVDMTVSEPFSVCMAKMNRVMDEMEKILGRKK